MVSLQCKDPTTEMKRILLHILVIFAAITATAQINTEQVLRVGQNALYFEDYMLSIQYFNRVIQAKPYLAQPYFYRAIAKLNLEDYVGAEADATEALDRNPYLTDAWEVRGVARQNLGRNREAISDYDHALELLPNNRHLLYNKALALMDIDDYAGADSTYTDLLTAYPNNDGAYVGRAQLRLAQGDTTAAEADIDRALEINRNNANAYIIRADININRDDNVEAALAAIDEAIRLRPRIAGLYINRAYLRYQRDDFFGAMADFDYAIQLDPLNYTALFNRSLLLMESGSYDRALLDLDRLIELNPNDMRAYYNRSLVCSQKGLYDRAIADINHVIDAYPGLPDSYYIRGDIYAQLKDYNRAEADYNHAHRLARDLQPLEEQEQAATPERSTDEAARRFATMATVEDNAQIEEEYNNQAIRGHVQNRSHQIQSLGWMELAYHSVATELRPDTYYIKEVDDLNSTRILRFSICVTPELPIIDDATAAQHFSSIDYYNSYLSSHAPRAIDYLGRALDFMTLRDYAAATADINRALQLTPDQPVALYLRAQANFHSWQIARDNPDEQLDGATRASLQRKLLDDVATDLRRLIELSPRMAQAWYNLAVVHIAAEDYTSALAALNQAISLEPNLGEAWYNRGYVYLTLGNERLGIDDLSQAGQLGIVPAYNLIKRVTN